jgi:protein SCO1/2
MKKYCRWLMVCLIALVAHGALAAPVPLPTDSIYRANLTLTDAQSRRMPWAGQRGEVRIVSMFYTSCTFSCPMLVESIKVVLQALSSEERESLKVTLISLDPKRDTPAALTKMQKDRDLDPARWTLLRPEPQDTRTLAALLGVRYRALANGDFNHTTLSVLVDAEGRIVASTEGIRGVPDPAFLGAVRKTLAQH